MIRLFISYRRSDSMHAAQRVRAFMQSQFGADAVFIDRDIPPGSDWAQCLRERLADATDVVVLVGDAFLRELRRRGGPAATEEDDWLKTEIETALQLDKAIYPVLIGRLDMPDKAELPAPIQGFADHQAVFAREPAFDAAMAVLGRAIAARHGWVDPRPRADAGKASVGDLARLAAAASLAGLVALFALWQLGRLVHWLAAGTAGEAVESTAWLGIVHALLTMLWGLGPYLVYRSVAEIRARANLPVHNLLGALTMLNLGAALLAGGTFLLLSTRADWALRLRGLVPEMPGPWHYALQGVVLLAIVFAAVAVAMLEPVVRSWPAARRRRGMAGLHAAAVLVALASAWFAESLVRSMPPLAGVDAVPVIGYFMVAPALSGLLVAWDMARWSLGMSGRAWHSRALLAVAVGLYLACTLGYFAHGPVRLFVDLQ